ncbi:bacteriophage N4 receptor, outer membrane subunit [Escherichia coli]|uniref:Bacteriophage N4 receptor, outer membrane subunit n=1 Tax=Escherichia coli TaxID=562 RepID=A0A376TJF5_ECOLX|nr:bacteriophage N4 receptor, outer membrane subunit [Escherichia coli]
MLPPGTVWQSVIGTRYPGVALYAWLQAEQRQPNAWQHRAVAYQAYQVEDYATALAAWQKISLHDMSNEDLLAAANTAQAAGNSAARDRWLQQAEQRGLGNNALYWWLHAQRYIPGQPELALSDLTRSINIAPSANAYVARATIYRQRHNVPAAVSDLPPRWNWNRIIATSRQRLVTPCGIAVISHSRGKCSNRRIKGFRTIRH